MSSEVILILVNKPHKPQMIVLKKWLTKNLAQYRYIISSQLGFTRKIKKFHPHAIITYNKDLYKEKVVRALTEYCTTGGKLLALHHNVSSMMLRRPEWLEFANVSITKGKDVPHPWSAIEGGDNYLYNLAPGHPITTEGLSYDSFAPNLQSLRHQLGISEFITDAGKPIYSFKLTAEQLSQVNTLEKEPALGILHSEYFVNGVLNPEPARKLLFAIYYKDEKTGVQYISANGGWITRRGNGILIYLMPGHSPAEYSDQFCTIIKNCLIYSE